MINNIDKVKEQFLKNNLQIRLGSIAANLARISSFSDNSHHSKAIESMIEESKFFIEWTAPTAELYIQEKLVLLQIELAQWQLSWETKGRRSFATKSLAE